MCKPLNVPNQPETNLPHILPGWICCRCRCYNGAWRDGCRNCGHANCLTAEVVAQIRAAERAECEAAGVPWPGDSSRTVEPRHQGKGET